MHQRLGSHKLALSTDRAQRSPDSRFKRITTLHRCALQRCPGHHHTAAPCCEQLPWLPCLPWPAAQPQPRLSPACLYQACRACQACQGYPACQVYQVM